MATLGLGDISFTGYQGSTTDKASFVLLKAVDSGTILTVTDNAWTGTALTTNEGNSVITFSGSFTAGTQFNYDASRATGLKWAVGATTSNLSDVTTSNFGLNSSGDNLFAYNGSTPPTSGTGLEWVSAFATNPFLTTGAFSTSLTFLPSIFVSTNSQFSLGLANNASNENGVYSGANVNGTVDQIRTAVYSIGNWTTFTTAGSQTIPPTKSFTIQGSSNSAPTDLNLSNSSILENSGVNAVVGDFSTLDPDSGNTFTYSLVSGSGSTDNTDFNISGNSLQANNSFDFESKSSYSIRVRTTDQGGLFFERAFLIQVMDVNEVNNLKLNEIKANPPGNTVAGDKYQYVELLGSPSLSLNNIYFVMINGNGSSAGTVDYVANLSGQSLGSNGLLMIKSPSSTGTHLAAVGTTVVTDSQFDKPGGAISKLTVSFYLISATGAIVQGTDYDLNNDGVLDNLPIGFSVIDNVGWSDGDVGDRVYGGVSLAQTQGTPDAATRIVGNTTTTISAWFNGDLYDIGNVPSQLLYDQTRGSPNLPVSPIVASLTPGQVNFAASIVNRQIFYNRSTSTEFGNGSGNPTNAIDSSKLPLLPGQTSTSANYTNYTRGLNGLIVDVLGLAGTVTAADFQFATWNGIASSGFVTNLVSPTISTIVGGGIAGSTRIKIEFPDYSIRNTWLRTTMLANPTTNLSTNDVFYFGNAIADINLGNMGTPIIVSTNELDAAGVRQHLSPSENSASIQSIYDVNKDGRVNSIDISIVRQNFGANLLRYFTAPVSLRLALNATSRVNSLSISELSITRQSTMVSVFQVPSQSRVQAPKPVTRHVKTELSNINES